MGAYDRLQPGLFIMRQGDRESKWHGHGPAPEYKGETAIHAMTMPPFYIIAQLKYTGTGFTKQTSSPLIASSTSTRRCSNTSCRIALASCQARRSFYPECSSLRRRISAASWLLRSS